jgi:hypothetical protein
MRRSRPPVIGPRGERLTLDDLPKPGQRWTIARKAVVVAAVHGGLLKLDEAQARFAMTADEFATWSTLLRTHGIDGLRTTRLQQYREGGAV